MSNENDRFTNIVISPFFLPHVLFLPTNSLFTNFSRLFISIFEVAVFVGILSDVFGISRTFVGNQNVEANSRKGGFGRLFTFGRRRKAILLLLVAFEHPKQKRPESRTFLRVRRSHIIFVKTIYKPRVVAPVPSNANKYCECEFASYTVEVEWQSMWYFAFYHLWLFRGIFNFIPMSMNVHHQFVFIFFLSFLSSLVVIQSSLLLFAPNRFVQFTSTCGFVCSLILYAS